MDNGTMGRFLADLKQKGFMEKILNVLMLSFGN